MPPAYAERTSIIRQWLIVTRWSQIFKRVNDLGAEPCTRSTEPDPPLRNEHPEKAGGVNRNIA